MKQKKLLRFGWVICISNNGYSASLEVRKLYPKLCDRRAERDGWIRVVDESGEDYLFPKRLFRPIKLPPSLEKSLRRSLRKR